MFHHSPGYLLSHFWKRIVLGGIFLALFASALSFVFPLEYRADAQMLVVSRTRYGVDPYTAVKSAERVGENIARIVGTDIFFAQVLSQPGFQLDTNRFVGTTERIRRNRWERTIDASVSFGTGVLNISAYHTDPSQAKAYASAVMETLVERGWEYVGGDVNLKIVNQPVVTALPVRPNILFNALGGFALGVLISGAFVLTRKKLL
ncbi:MAG: hypothetical protein HOE53_04830 [Candidatus Magasanikbacteria bacterium]|jgi:capsular polysaccharide biosynthesis protein|nr:hypothetical protein [Candidatus Magasanikbacteria bacterium]